MRKTVFSILVFGIASLALVLNACAPQKNLLEQVKDSGELRVLTRNAATTYYIGPHGPTGPEYDLVQAFADHLGVSVNLVVEDSLENILDKVANGDVPSQEQLPAIGCNIKWKAGNEPDYFN